MFDYSQVELILHPKLILSSNLKQEIAA